MLFFGCESANRRPFNGDPLLLDKKPVVSKAEDAAPDRLAQTEPTPAPCPAITPVAATMAADSKAAGTAENSQSIGKNVEAKPAVGNPKQPIPGIAVSRANSSQEAASLPPMRRQVPDTYGHSPNYTWLQGVLDRHYQGHFDLRYCDPAVEDKWGGKVSLIDDPRLAQFKDGDLILVEGEIDPDKVPHNAWHHYPNYRIKDIWLVKRDQ
jgi:hypothetical protein